MYECMKGISIDDIYYDLPTLIVLLINSETGLWQLLSLFWKFMNAWQHQRIKTDKQRVNITDSQPQKLLTG